MHKNVERIFLAFLLSFVGAMIAKQLETLWWIGLIFGFITGYIGYDIRGFLRAIPIAFRKASARPESSITAKAWLANFCYYTFYTIGAGISISFTAWFIVAVILVGPTHIGEIFPLAAIVSAVWTLIFCFITSSTAINPKYRKQHIELMSGAVLWMHPIPFAIRTLPLGIFYALRGVAWVTEKGCEFGWRFLCHLFYLVHSHERVLFGLDVAIGVAVGHHTGNALLGGLIGVAVWVIDWHLISVKWLKIQPAR